MPQLLRHIRRRGLAQSLLLVLPVFLVSCKATSDSDAPAAAADGGPWAPTVIDIETLKITPERVSPGKPVTVSFTARPEHASRITSVDLYLIPGIYSADATEKYDPATGAFRCNIPMGVLKFEQRYEVRVGFRFDWTDGKSYRRSPRAGVVTVTRYPDQQYTAEGFADAVAGAEAAIGKAETRIAVAGNQTVLSDFVAEMRADVVTARERFAAGDHSSARVHLERAQGKATQTENDLSRVAYRYGLRRFLATVPSENKPLLTLLAGGGIKAFNDDDVRLIKEVGFGTVSAWGADQVKQLDGYGLDSVVSRAPVRFTQAYLKKHPEHRQHRYLISDPVSAKGATVSVPLFYGFFPDHYDTDTAGDPHRYWRVLDETADTKVPPGQWDYDDGSKSVTVRGAIPEHVYRVIFLVQPADVPFFHGFGDPVYPGCEKHVLSGMERFFSGLPGLDVYRPTSIYFPFPKIDKRLHQNGKEGRRGWHFFYSYQWGTAPVVQDMFEKETGVPFDPTWIVDGGRYGDVNYPPQPGYLTWMAFHRKRLEQHAKKAFDVAHKHGVPVRVFWGDHWMGMEPHLDFFTNTGAEQIVKACSSAIVCRMTADIPAPTKAIIRFSPWFSRGELFGTKNPTGKMRSKWSDIKRGALFSCPDGLTFGGETLRVGMRDEKIYNTMRDITDEFRAIYACTNGRKPYTHDLNVYVINSWGKMRPWTGWLQLYKSCYIQTHLTDLPANVRFLSLKGIAEHGVPADADVLLNYGEPGSAWSGGFYWEDERLVEAVKAFVAKGGGLVGVGAPSHIDGNRWQLADVLGVTYEDGTDEGARNGSYGPYDDAFLFKGSPSNWSEPMRGTATAHWITADLHGETAPIQTNVRVKPVADDVQLLCSGDGSSFAAPVVTARSHKSGRAVYINGYATTGDYGTVLRRALFWAAGKEALWDRLRAEAPDVFVYYYPEGKHLLVYNMNTEPVKTRIRIDPTVLGAPANAELSLQDEMNGETVFSGVGGALRDGAALQVPGRAIRFLLPHVR